MTNYPVVFISHSLRGDIQENIQRTKEICGVALEYGYLPIAPNIYVEFFELKTPEDEQKGIEIGLQMLSMCQELWVFGNISPGVQAEIDFAKEREMGIERMYDVDDLRANLKERNT